jgi:hypothetical protein
MYERPRSVLLLYVLVGIVAAYLCREQFYLWVFFMLGAVHYAGEYIVRRDEVPKRIRNIINILSTLCLAMALLSGAIYLTQRFNLL